jgi:hypothetical protein
MGNAWGMEQGAWSMGQGAWVICFIFVRLRKDFAWQAGAFLFKGI